MSGYLKCWFLSPNFSDTEIKQSTSDLWFVGWGHLKIQLSPKNARLKILELFATGTKV